MSIEKYLTAGCDTHDARTTPRSGFSRIVAYIPGEPTVLSLAKTSSLEKRLLPIVHSFMQTRYRELR